jgi:hypothetical protein
MKSSQGSRQNAEAEAEAEGRRQATGNKQQATRSNAGRIKNYELLAVL